MFNTLSLLLALLLLAPGGAEQPGADEPVAAPVGATELPVAPARQGDESFQIAFEMLVGNDVALERVEVELDLPSGVVVVPLVDDGSLPEDMAWDGVFVGIWRGPWLRWAHVRLLGGTQDAPEVLAEGLERFSDVRRAHVAWRLVPVQRRFHGFRTAATPLAGTDDVRGRVELLGSFGWAAVLAIFMVTLAVRAREGRP
ncbi:MAG: hypothetical protein ABIO70_13755 [Pseudomonadota bacterium]